MPNGYTSKYRRKTRPRKPHKWRPQSCRKSSRPISQDLFAKCRERKLDCQIRGAIVLVNHWVHFDDLKTQHPPVIGNDLHCEMSLAIGCTAANWCAHTRCVLGIHPV